jgi:NIPSNAP
MVCRTLTRKEKRMKAALALFGLLGLIVMSTPAAADEKKADEKKADARVFELRIYHAAPGKMDALNARFRDHTNKLFKKHGMEIIAFWNPTDPKEAESKLIYILAYPSKEAADKSWQAFRDDPDWKTAKDASEKDGKLVDKVESTFMKPTDYSPIK